MNARAKRAIANCEYLKFCPRPMVQSSLLIRGNRTIWVPTCRLCTVLADRERI